MKFITNTMKNIIGITTDYLDYSCDEMSSIVPELIIRRPVYQQDDLNRLSLYSCPKKTLGKKITKQLRSIEPRLCLKNIIPIMSWLPRYNWKSHIFGDLVAGITVAIMHIPQGMAYAILGNVPPIIGIYMAFFPVLVYFIFGTSKHNSMGSFAVICMMVGKIVLYHTSVSRVDIKNSTILISNPDIHVNSDRSLEHSQIEIATAVTFMVALMQLAMYFLRLGFITALLSETLISGFTTGAAVHVMTSQIKDLFGLNLPKRMGVFKVVLTCYDIFRNIDNVNIVAMVISTVTIIIIVFNNEVLKIQLAKHCSFPIPIEMIVVILGTSISIYTNLETSYNIITVGDIPIGFPEPKIPPMDVLPHIILDSFVITMVSYTISMSMALIFSQKLNYDVDPNQELMALGLGNFIGSFFSCMPFCTSLSRSLIQQTVGGQSQVASFISCGILLFVLLWIGPFFEPLPRCVLASIIVVALKGMLMQVKDFFRFLRLSHVDAIIWMVTFLTVIIFDIEYGLLIGIVLCIGNLLTLSMRPYTCSLALVPDTDFYLDSKRFKKTVEISGLKIFHYCGGLNFASRQNFRKDIHRITGIIPQKELLQRKRTEIGNNKYLATELKILKVLVLDFSSMVHIDIAGVTTLREIVDDYGKIDTFVYIAGCSVPVFETMQKCNDAENKQGYFTLFPTVNDAVNFARYKNYISFTSIWMTTQTPLEENHINELLTLNDAASMKYHNMDSINIQINNYEPNSRKRSTLQYGTFIKYDQI